jgi:hypothetical protein
MKLYRDFLVNVAAGWFFALFAAVAVGNLMQGLTAAILCVTCFLMAQELNRLEINNSCDSASARIDT